MQKVFVLMVIGMFLFAGLAFAGEKAPQKVVDLAKSELTTPMIKIITTNPITNFAPTFRFLNHFITIFLQIVPSRKEKKESGGLKTRPPQIVYSTLSTSIPIVIAPITLLLSFTGTDTWTR